MANTAHDGGVELYNFPAPEELPQLAWLGPVYTSALVDQLDAGLQRQDVGNELIAVKSEAPPQLTATTKGGGPVELIVGQQARFELQALVRDGSGRHWRLRGRLTLVGEQLHDGRTAVRSGFDLVSADAV